MTRAEERCHAGAGHGEPLLRGTYGWLCDDCWASTVRVVSKYIRIDPATGTAPPTSTAVIR